MNNFQEFRPARQRGLIIHIGILFLSMAASGGFLLLANTQEKRGFFILYLIGCVVAFLPIPLTLYRLFSLLRAKYIIDRDGFHIQWGLRTEDIPMHEIEWLRTASDMPYAIPLPRFSIQGAITGNQRTDDLGNLEYLASDSRMLILVASRQKIFVISPRDSEEFLKSFRYFAEMGSITPIQARSSNAEFLTTTLFKDKYARAFILGGLILSLILLITVSFIIPSKDSVTLGFNPTSKAIEQAPSERLLLLPVATFFMLVTDVSLGSYLYRKEGLRMASYFAFASSFILPLSFLALIVAYIL
jgi:hypothetical protein